MGKLKKPSRPPLLSDDPLPKTRNRSQKNLQDDQELVDKNLSRKIFLQARQQLEEEEMEHEFEDSNLSKKSTPSKSLRPLSEDEFSEGEEDLEIEKELVSSFLNHLKSIRIELQKKMKRR